MTKLTQQLANKQKMTGAHCKTCTSVIFATYFNKTNNPNPLPTGKKFGFVLFGAAQNLQPLIWSFINIGKRIVDLAECIQRKAKILLFIRIE